MSSLQEKYNKNQTIYNYQIPSAFGLEECNTIQSNTLLLQRLENLVFSIVVLGLIISQFCDVAIIVVILHKPI
jgi:hypothetical protein